MPDFFPLRSSVPKNESLKSSEVDVSEQKGSIRQPHHQMQRWLTSNLHIIFNCKPHLVLGSFWLLGDQSACFCAINMLDSTTASLCSNFCISASSLRLTCSYIAFSLILRSCCDLNSSPPSQIDHHDLQLGFLKLCRPTDIMAIRNSYSL